MTDLREYFCKIIKICGESSDYSRRVSWIHELAMQALGFTENQRAVRHDRALMRSEEYKENLRYIPRGKAKRMLREKISLEENDEFYHTKLPSMRRRACDEP